MRRLAVTAVMLCLTIIGCGGAEPTPDSAVVRTSETSSTPPTTQPNNGLQEYGSVQGVLDDLMAAGITCTGLKMSPNPSFAVEQGSCFVGADEIVIALHSSVPERDNQAEQLTDLMSGIDGEFRIILGGNWLVNTADSPIWTDVREALGGRVMTT